MKKSSQVSVLILVLALFLRTVATRTAPPGFTGDEAVFGYNAYSILKTGRDEYGNFLPIFFRAFGDYRPPAYIYLSLPFILIFGLNELATRFLSLAVSLLSILLIYKLSLLIFKKKKAAIFASFFLATSSWHILLSRMAVMSMLSCFFITLGVYFFLYWLKNQRAWLLTFSFLSFVIAVYAYHNARLTVPLLMLGFLFLFFKKMMDFKKALGINLLLMILLLLPLGLAFLRNPDKMLRRGVYQSFWHRGDIEARLQDDRTKDNPQQAPLLTKFFHPRPVYLLKEFLRRYAQHFDFSYLFLKGDPHERFQIPGVGLINFALAPPFFYGCYQLIKRAKREYLILLVWFVTSPLVASQGINTPNSLHTFDAITVFYLVIGFGFASGLDLWDKWHGKRKLVTALMFLLVFVFYFSRFLHSYFYLLPQKSEYAHYWDYGMKELMGKVERFEGEYSKIAFIGRIYHEFLIFYKRYPPQKYQPEAKISPIADEAGFEHVIKFNKYQFPRNWQETEKNFETLYIADNQEVPREAFFGTTDCPGKEKLFLRIREVIYFKDGAVAFRVFDIPGEQEKHKENFCKKTSS